MDSYSTFYRIIPESISWFRIAAVAICMLSTIAVTCHADNVIVNFRGDITSGTCTINTENNQVVELGDTSITYFNTPGDVSPEKSFAIIVNCPAGGPEKATVMFSGVSASNGDLLALDEGGATGVALRINEESGELIKLNTPSTSMILTEGEGMLKFKAQYQSLTERSSITAGLANATAQFTINYQ